MILEKLEIKQVRSVGFFKESFSPKINILLGPNGAGKTTILESIHLLSLARSFRKNESTSLISQEKEYLLVNGVITNPSEKIKIQVGVSKKEKRIQINGKRVKKRKDLIGLFPTVVFSPDLNDVVSGSKADRHDFFNRIFCTVDHQFTADLLKFFKILNQRRTLIKQGDDNQLKIWNNLYAEICLKIWEKRHKLFTGFCEEFYRVWNDSFPQKNSEILYTRKSIPEKNWIKENLNEIRVEEINKKRVLFGPHKDDYSFVFEKRDLRKFGSQGERKFFHYMLRLAEAEYIRKISGKTPVLLLDDLFAKMDELRIEKIINPFMNNFQMFITSTDIHRKGINRFLSKETKTIQILKN